MIKLEIIFGNIISLLALIILLLAVSKTTKRELLIFQGISYIFFAVAGVILKGYSGVVQDIVGCIRNCTILAKKNTYIIQIILIFISILLGLALNNCSYIGILPIVGSFQYAVFSMLNSIKLKTLKKSILFNSLLMIIYSIYIQNYINILTNTIVIIISCKDIMSTKDD